MLAKFSLVRTCSGWSLVQRWCVAVLMGVLRWEGRCRLLLLALYLICATVSAEHLNGGALTYKRNRNLRLRGGGRGVEGGTGGRRVEGSGVEKGGGVGEVAIATTQDIAEERPMSLLHINTLTLLFYSCLGAAMPYIPIYYRHLKVSDTQIGLLGAITPLVTFCVSPLWGALADGTGKHKLILLGTFVSSVIMRCLLAVLPSISGSNKHMLMLCGIVASTAAMFAPGKAFYDPCNCL
jgi:hypothetical protein